MINSEDIIEMAKRCLNCKKPGCIKGCPSNVSIPDILTKVKSNHFDDALKILHRDNNLEFICGTLCDHYRQCMGNCVYGFEKAVNISKIMTELGLLNLKQKMICQSYNGYSVGIVGGGPCGLSIAERLLENGFAVTIFDKKKALGGVLSSYMPSFRFDENLINDYVDKLVANGLQIKYEYELGNNLLLDDLKGFDYVVFTIGSAISRKVLKSNGVIDAFDILELAKKNYLDYSGKDCLVIGGGNTAYDVARVMKKAGSNVSIVYRRDIDNSPASKSEILIAKNEGINILELYAPVEVLYNNEHISGLRVQKTILEQNDGSKRKKFLLTDEYKTLNANIIIEATGSSCDYNYLKMVIPEAFNEEGWPANFQYDKYYFGGDFFLGAANFSKANESAKMIVNDIIKNIKRSIG